MKKDDYVYLRHILDSGLEWVDPFPSIGGASITVSIGPVSIV